MSDKQSRYRKHKAEQGFHRVEVLVPEEAATHLKAYARALRDAHRLGARFPSFDGMPPASDGTYSRKPASILPKADRKSGKPEPKIVSGRHAMQKKPDFSGGLF